MSKETSPKVASDASDVLRDDDTGNKSKSAAGSALGQTNAPEKSTSDEVAEKASDVLQDGRTSDESKSAAGSALGQKEKD